MRTERGITDIAADLMREFATLIRKDFLLARAEISEKFSLLGAAVTMIVIGAVFLMAALVLLLEAIVAGLVAEGFSQMAAALMVGGAALIFGALLLWIGVRRLRPDNLAPNRTVEQLQRDVAVARHQMSRS